MERITLKMAEGDLCELHFEHLNKGLKMRLLKQVEVKYEGKFSLLTRPDLKPNSKNVPTSIMKHKPDGTLRLATHDEVKKVTRALRA